MEFRFNTPQSYAQNLGGKPHLLLRSAIAKGGVQRALDQRESKAEGPIYSPKRISEAIAITRAQLDDWEAYIGTQVSAPIEIIADDALSSTPTRQGTRDPKDRLVVTELIMEPANGSLQRILHADAQIPLVSK